MINFDLHVHSFFSPCSLLNFSQIEAGCKRKNIGGVAITDHDTIDGALRFKECSSLFVIIGEEVSARDGELIGLFISERVPPGMSLIETVKAIKSQGGLVYLPHIADWTRKGISWEGIRRIQSEIDIVEVFNSRTWLPGVEQKARTFAKEHGLVQVAASDAHSASELGRGLVSIACNPQSPQEMLELLQEGEIVREEKTRIYQRSLTTLKARISHRLGLLPGF